MIKGKFVKAFDFVTMGLIRVFGKWFKPLLKPVYRVYENWLWTQVVNGPKPKHVAIIPDGNRRWARLQGLNPLYGHEVGYEKVKEVLNWLWELGVKIATIYGMSYENCTRRSEEERNHLMNLLRRSLDEFGSDDYLSKYRVRVKFVGRLELIPPDILSKIAEVEERSSKYDEHFLNIALCYGGRQEIVDAVVKLVKDVLEGNVRVEDVNEDLFRRYLSTSHLSINGFEEPDLVIRTSGELRISNFLLWQIAYSELYFCDVYWPEFRRIDLLRAVRSYQKRERRFGR